MANGSRGREYIAYFIHCKHAHCWGALRPQCSITSQHNRMVKRESHALLQASTLQHSWGLVCAAWASAAGLRRWSVKPQKHSLEGIHCHLLRLRWMCTLHALAGLYKNPPIGWRDPPHGHLWRDCLLLPRTLERPRTCCPAARSTRGLRMNQITVHAMHCHGQPWPLHLRSHGNTRRPATHQSAF